MTTLLLDRRDYTIKTCDFRGVNVVCWPPKREVKRWLRVAWLRWTKHPVLIHSEDDLVRLGYATV